MKKISYLLAVLVLCAISASATGISKNKAQTVATSFFQKGLMKANVGEVKLVKEYASSKDAPAAVFAFSRGENVVFVSAEDKMPAILGYTENADMDDMPPALEAMLQYYAQLTDAVRAGKIEAPKLYASAEKVDTLLRTAWYQKAPFWDLCPELDGKKCYNGCISTAFAQIMKYYNWPEKPKGKTPVYTAGKHKLKIPSVDLESHTYNWDNMIGVYNEGEYTEEQGKEVAQLCYDLAAAFYMDFDTLGSGSQLPKSARAVRDNFGYNKKMKVDYADYYTEEEWVAKLKNELSLGRPLPYCGMKTNYFEGGHCFVLDGYNTDGLFHVNWGWRGKFTGYFLITSLDPEVPGIEGKGSWNGFYTKQQTIFDLFPDRDGTTIAEEDYQIEYENCVGGTKSKQVRIEFLKNLSMDDFKGSLIMQLVDENGKMAAEQTVKKDLYLAADSSLDNSFQIALDDFFDFSTFADGIYHTQLVAVSDSTGNRFPVHRTKPDWRICVRDGVFKGISSTAVLEGDIIYEVSMKDEETVNVKMKAQVTNVDYIAWPKGNAINLRCTLFDPKTEERFNSSHPTYKDIQPGESITIEYEFELVGGLTVDIDDDTILVLEMFMNADFSNGPNKGHVICQIIRTLNDFLADGIKDVKINKKVNTSAFSLDGKRVNASSAKGVIIKDGKKTVNK